uniref:Cytochrome c oxidase assembly factor 5 n=1 Tax=Sinocyclocheilus grahami TaxID=75366 RepID=A0A672K387_SINGR
MPKYYEDKEDDGRACAGLREDFKACLLQHDCVAKVISSIAFSLTDLSCLSRQL